MPKPTYHTIKHLIPACIGLLLMLLTACKKDRIPEYHADGEVEQLFIGSDPGKTKVNVVILGDGYTKDDLTKGGVCDKQIKDATKYLFTIPPYSTYQQYFKVSAVYAESKNRGAGIGEGDTLSTKFGTYFDSVTTRLLETDNYDLANRYASKATPGSTPNLIIILVNDETYGGSGGALAVVSTTSEGYFKTMTHEIGHTFVGLGDEYEDPDLAPYRDKTFVNYLPNLDLTNDPDKVKWSAFLKLPAYQKSTGIFEGGYYYPTGVYRPAASSVMRDNFNVSNYNAPSRLAIVKHIFAIIDKPFSMGDFLVNDKQAITTETGTLPPNRNFLIMNDFLNPKERLIQLNTHPNL